MKKLKLFILLLVTGLISGAASLPYAYVISIISGPAVRIPGISAPTVIQLNGVRFARVEWFGPLGANTIISTSGAKGEIANIVLPGTYNAQDVEVTHTTTDGDHENWHDAGTIAIPALIHSIVWQPSTSIVCIQSNGDTYITRVVWKRNGRAISGNSFCVDGRLPGVYTAAITYTYGGVSVTLDASPLTVSQSPDAPQFDVKTSSGRIVSTYNPVTPPTIVVNNSNRYDEYWLYKDDVGIATSLPASAPVQITGPGVYNLGGWFAVSGGRSVAYTADISLPKGNIPVPLITAQNNGVLTYGAGSLQLSSTADGDGLATYNHGYQWYFNGREITGQTNKTITVSIPGDYTVRGCAQYPDGSSQCQTSLAFHVTGESTTVNYVRAKNPLIRNVTSQGQLDALTFRQANASTAYLDGMGRPIEQVQQAFSPLGHDIVSFNRYDSSGREPKKFLPFTGSSGNGDFMVISPSLAPLLLFYQRENDKVANSAFPFAESLFETSPLGRVLKQGSPGEEWQINNHHAKSMAYRSNTTADDVRIWVKSGARVTSDGTYGVDQLAVTEGTDEDGNLSREFKDKDGHVVLSERVVEAGVKLRTYFVFDDLGRQTCIIPPKTAAALPASGSASIASDVQARECFSYEYDERNRLISKVIPGGGTTYIVYDRWDRTALMQQGNQRTANKWTFYKYDAMNRIVLTGEVVIVADYATASQSVNTFYSGAATNPSLRYEEAGSAIHGYTNRSFPVVPGQFNVYNVSYYDNYSFVTQFGTQYQFVPELSIGVTTYSTGVRSLATGTKEMILGTQTYLKSVTYYDNDHRKIQAISENHLGGVDRMSLFLDFTGKVLRTKEVHNGRQAVTVDQNFTYDHAGRRLDAYHTITTGGRTGDRVLLCRYGYNELGQVVEKNMHSLDSARFLQSEDMEYNIRGWLSKMNPTETENNVQFQDLYGFELSYTTATGFADFQPSFTGNITAFSEMRSGNGDVSGAFKSSYSYHYDKRSQLTAATYYQPSNGSSPSGNGNYDMPVITYDENGNIKSLKRKGITTAGTPGVIDDLNYSYNGNQLIQVNEAADRQRGYIKK